MESLKPPTTTGWKSWSAKKKALLLTSVVIFIIALGVGLGVGLGLGLHKGEDNEDENEGDSKTNNTNIWQPAVGTSWQIVLRYALNDTSVDVDVYDIDLYDNEKSVMDELHSDGRKVICYFSAGTYEDWREDASQFPKNTLGDGLPDWPGEKWVDIRSSKVRDIMSARLDLAVEKGCDGVDPDNVDGYDNENGLGLEEDDSVDYMNWLAGEAHGRNLSIGLKNAGDIIPKVIGRMQWSVNEQCAEYEECDVYAPFVKKGKPVFHIEYPKGDETNDEVMVRGAKKVQACDFEDSGDFSTVIKNMDLDNWIQTC